MMQRVNTQNSSALLRRQDRTLLKFAANISTMFNEADELLRLNHAASLGFKYVEWLFPYNRNAQAIASTLEDNALDLVLINAALGNPKDGDRGIGAIPGREDDFKFAMSDAIAYATELDVPMIHVMAGKCKDPKQRSNYVETFAQNLAWAVKQTDSSKLQLLVEPLNHVDTPNYLIGTTDQALEVIQLVDANIGLQFDFYHAQIMEGNLGATIERLFDTIAHVQFSSLPGRHEPQHGEVNCQHLFDMLESLSYQGHIGGEYQPKTTVEEGLDWAKPYGIGA